jgi:hypothetical protein
MVPVPLKVALTSNYLQYVLYVVIKMCVDVAGTNRGDLDRNEVVRALSMHFGQAPPQSFLDAAFATLGKDPQQATFNKKEYKALIKLFDILPKQKAFLASDVLSTHFEEFSKNVSYSSSSL